MRQLITGAVAAFLASGVYAGDYDFLDRHFAGGPGAAFYFNLPLTTDGLSPRLINAGLRLGHNEAQLFKEFDPQRRGLLYAPLLDFNFSLQQVSTLSIQGLPMFSFGPDGIIYNALDGAEDDDDDEAGWIWWALGAVGGGILASCLTDNWPCDGGGDGDDDDDDNGGGTGGGGTGGGGTGGGGTGGGGSSSGGGGSSSGGSSSTSGNTGGNNTATGGGSTATGG